MTEKELGSGQKSQKKGIQLKKRNTEEELGELSVGSLDESHEFSLLKRMIEKSRDERFATAGDLWNSLDALQQSGYFAEVQKAGDRVLTFRLQGGIQQHCGQFLGRQGTCQPERGGRA